MILRIKRVLTVVLNYQKEDMEEVAAAHHVTGTKLPLYAFKRVNKIETEMDVHGHEVREPEPPIAFLDSLILGEWKDHVRRGLFRYDITAHETKVISGQYGFIAQLNYPRHLKKRPTEFRVEKVVQPFDGNKFRFTKWGKKRCSSSLRQVKIVKVVSINVSPIKYGHVLLIPRVLECLLQRIDCVSFLLALYTAAGAGNPHFRLGYNSLGAFATINHLHFQKAPTRKIITSGGCVKISELFNYPVRGLVFEGGNSLQDLSNTVSDACICLQENNIPYNVLIVDCGKRIFLFPQLSSEFLDTQVNPSVWEINGHMVLKRKKDYEEASEENAWRLLAKHNWEADAKPKSHGDVDVINKSSRPAMVSGTPECLVHQYIL
ncbi:GDP-L-galactose phosphorylase 1 [Citrus sinensis]|uniref:GDP-L-galactose phosphorylase 1 n=1 Tax=Citrus sinensis TaxID=2711 RepID=A0ACB8HXY4_CITSI|nr:GDP-L-galactose phosphorylase 1 [Citrus sinensis]